MEQQKIISFSMDSLMDEQRRFYVNADFLLREVAGEFILVPVGEGSELLNGMIAVNDTFAFLWKQFQVPKSVNEVISIVREQYEIDESIEKDILQFVYEGLYYQLMKEEEK